MMGLLVRKIKFTGLRWSYECFYIEYKLVV